MAAEHEELFRTLLKLKLHMAAAVVSQELAAESGLGQHLALALLSTGCVVIWKGVVLRKTHPRAAVLVEKAGIDLVFVAFNMLLVSRLPKGLFVWFLPVLCFGIFIVPFVVPALPRAAAAFA